jgi:predicted RNase H-like nuclease
MRLYGVDGCRGGWVVASADPGLGGLCFERLADLGPLLARAAAGQALVVVDTPIGLPEAGPRACDLAARTRLGAPRAASVFPAPCQAALLGANYAEACALNADACGRRLTLECFHLLPKIRQLDAVMTPDLQRWVREGHPEVIFAELAGGPRGLAHYKKTAAGEAERLGLLARYLPALSADGLSEARAGLGRAAPARDDLVDAAACLVAAYRLRRGLARCLPSDEPPRNARGLRMEIIG